MNIMKEIVTGPLEGISRSSETDSTESELQLQPIIATKVSKILLDLMFQNELPLRLK